MDRQALDTLRANLVEATRRGLDLCRQAPAGETIYAYALVMASVNGEALQPWCHTEESFAKKEARWGADDGRAGHRRYNPDEWWARHGGPVPGGRGGDWWDDLRGDIAGLHRQLGRERPDVTYELLIDTLKALDAAGYFGAGPAREAVTLMVYISDDAASDTWWPESVRRLNPPPVVERFRKALGQGKR